MLEILESKDLDFLKYLDEHCKEHNIKELTGQLVNEIESNY